MPDDSPWAVILAAGSGTRLRTVVESLFGEPLPKQYCRFRGPHTLLQLAVRRVLPLVEAPRCIVVIAPEHRRRADEQLADFPGVTIIEQPCDRGTAAGVLLPLTSILESDPGARVVLLPSDHVFADEELALRGIAEVDRAVALGRAEIVLMGVVPDAVHGDYGWIEMDGSLGRGGLRRVVRFWEKPGVERASVLREIGALWNTMILVARATSLRDLYAEHLPRLAEAFRAYGAAPPGDRRRFLSMIYQEIEPADLSRDLLGRAAGLLAYAWPAEVGWSDVGTPPRLRAWLGDGIRDVSPLRPPKGPL